ncbi:MAG TPA: hypothetical protein VFL04_07390, partial [Rectinemataceae bacterium]|nr:hypothetical protein [Rectinemataceae bacterium]
RLALYEPPFIVDSSRPPLPGDYFQRISALLAEGRRGEAVEYFLSTGPAMPGELIARMRKTPMWAGLEALANTLPYDGLVMGDTMAGRSLPEGAWAGAKMPVLVMAGGASPAWAANSVRALASVLPDARSLMLEGQTHGASPESLLPALKEFFLA